ncbi:MAG: hypothetical protein R2940_16270 [Syntrophotaleaceae bacterium]
MARGHKTGGRQKGTPNRMTASVKEALEEAFERLGGVEVLAKWAEENPGEFFRLWVKILPRDFNAVVECRPSLEDLICGTGLAGGQANE